MQRNLRALAASLATSLYNSSHLTRRAPRNAALIVACVATFTFGGCLGIGNYQFGSRTLFPNDIETVYVPVFQSSSFRKGLGEELTEAVIKEIEKRTPYKVVGTPNADTILTGRIVNENKHLLFQSLTGDPREMEVSLKVEVNWANSRGETIREIPAVPVPKAAVSVNAADNLVAEVGQSTATSQLKAIQQLAEQIVNLMEAPW